MIDFTLDTLMYSTMYYIFSVHYTRLKCLLYFDFLFCLHAEGRFPGWRVWVVFYSFIEIIYSIFPSYLKDQKHLPTCHMLHVTVSVVHVSFSFFFFFFQSRMCFKMILCTRLVNLVSAFLLEEKKKKV